MSTPIQFWNRDTQAMETEAVYGEKWLRWTYETLPGKALLHGVVKRALFSKWYGWRMDQPKTQEKVAPFIESYDVDPGEFANTAESFESFNAFFYRKLKPEARPIHPDTNSITFPADGRHLVFPEVGREEGFFIKGQEIDLPTLLGSETLAERYTGGTMILSRLCPVDYHRYHFPTSGTPGEPRLLNGPLYSVSPIALRKEIRYLFENKRCLTELVSETLGKVQLIEVGATCVGSMEHTYQPTQPVHKGDEKGYFRFGGSSTITLFEPGRVQLESDLIEHSAKCVEVYAQMGDIMGTKKG